MSDGPALPTEINNYLPEGVIQVYDYEHRLICTYFLSSGVVIWPDGRMERLGDE